MKTNFTRLRYILAALMCCLVSMGVWGQSYTVEQRTFTTISANSLNGDTNISYTANKGGGTSAPAINGGVIRLYQNSGGAGGGTITISVAENCVLNSVAIGSSMTTKIAYTLNAETKKSATSNLAANAIYTISDQTATSITFHCMGTTSSSRLYVNFLSVTYTKAATTFVEIPTFTPESGTEFTESLDVTLACATEGAAIHYTTDGTDPSVSSALYTTPFSIAETTTVKAIAVKDGLDNSEIAEATYTKVLPTPNFAYSTESVTTNLGEIFAAPTLTYNGSNDLSGLNISYASSNSNVATVDIATGEVQILSEGTTTISATVEATDTHLTAQTSYELNIIDPNKVELYSYDFANKTLPICQNDFITSGNLYYENNTLRLSTGNGGGSITTKNAAINGKVTITINAKAYSPSYKGLLTIKLGDNEGTVNVENVEFENYSINLESFIPSELTISTPDKNTRINLSKIIITGKKTFIDTNGTMTLAGNWTQSDLSALDLTDPTITVINMVGITIPTDAPDLTPANPNCLIYVADGAAVPTTWKNVVAGGFASTISLQDGYNFYNAEEIITETVTYTRTFAKGWNTFSLPFDAEIPTDDVIEEFDLQTESSIKFKTATGIYANQAYLIDIATDNTEKTFTATEVLVPVTASTGDIFKSNFIKQTGADVEGKYILVLEDDKEVFAPANDQATLAAFRGYIDLSATPNPAKKFTIEHDGGATNVDHAKAENGLRIYSENGALVIYSNEVQNVQIYAIDGRMIKNIQLSEGNNTINGLSKGIYLMNHQKAVVN